MEQLRYVSLVAAPAWTVLCNARIDGVGTSSRQCHAWRHRPTLRSVTARGAHASLPPCRCDAGPGRPDAVPRHGRRARCPGARSVRPGKRSAVRYLVPSREAGPPTLYVGVGAQDRVRCTLLFSCTKRGPADSVDPFLRQFSADAPGVSLPAWHWQ